MIGQAWSLVLSEPVKRRILVAHCLEMPDSLAADLEAIQVRRPTMRHYSNTSGNILLVLRYQRVFFLFNQLLMGNWWPHCSRHDGLFHSINPR